ncbi:hypothetical protein [Gemmata massiliana]|uniref:hypothetical protein n=1 Tax=Gemmata massiliana TaxID=1210884 RepID=UPI0013A6E6E9|nr:hypothetical protein [Gemmata massiliana]
MGTAETSYEVILPQSRVVLTYTIPRAESDYLSFQLQNANSIPVDTWSVTEPDWGTPEDPNDPDEVDPDGDWKLLNTLFQEVQRHVTGWDKVVNDIEQALSAQGPIGRTPRP